MKMKSLIFIVALCGFFIPCLSNASELADDKSRALLSEIRTDISQTAAKIKGLEEQQNNIDWRIHLFRSSSKLIKIGVVIEPRTQLILSVTTGGIGQELGVKPGDIISQAYKNGNAIANDISQLELTHGDELKLVVERADKTLTLKEMVRSNYTPRWDLYSATLAEASDFSGELKDNFEHDIQSEQSSLFLTALQARIDSKLAEIYRLESKRTSKPLAIEAYNEAHTETRLGLLIDKNTNTVISVVKDSNADSLGFKSGDIITEAIVNGKSSKNGLQSLNISDGDNLSFSIRRDGKERLLSSKAKSVDIPSWRLSVDSKETYETGSCGIITVFFDTPFTQDIYKAQLTEVDGDLLSPLRRNDSVKLKAGKHKLLIHEKIPSDLKRRAGSGKLIEFLVEPNKRYFLGVKFDRNKRFTKTDQFWEPYVWKVEGYECSLD